MRKLIMATFVAFISVFASITASKAAPVAPITLPYSISSNAIQHAELLPAQYRRDRRWRRDRRYRRGYRRPYYGYGYRPAYRSCRRVRRSCRARFGGGRDFRRCVRRRGC